MSKHIKLTKYIGFAIFLCHTTLALAGEPISPIPDKLDTDPDKVALGMLLFNDPRMSINQNQTCASCHSLAPEGYGADVGNAVSAGSVPGKFGGRNSPTVLNSALNFVQFWDGRAAHLAEQAEGPVVNPVEMGMPSWDEVVKRISAIPTYKEQFGKLYNGEISKATITNAIAEFEKTLLTPDSPFDRYLKGDSNALTAQQKRGYELFKSYGCIACHQGQNVGGNMYQKFGILKDIAQDSGTLGRDMGRFEVTGNEMDKHVFKVPSLRLVSKTPPYFHDGSVKTLDGAVKVMVDYQLGRTVPQKDIDDIVSFLESLAGELPQGAK